MQAGQPAPWAGQLLSVELALKLAQTGESCSDRLKLAVNRAQRDCDVETVRVESSHRAALAAMQADLQRANAAADRARALAAKEAPPWWSAPWFVASLTAVVTASVVTFVAVHAK